MSTQKGSADSTGSEPRTGRDGRNDPSDERSAGDSDTTASPGSVPAAAISPEEDALIAELPHASAVALRLHSAGHPDATIAVALGIPALSVPVTLQIAQAKLDALRHAV